MAIENTEPIDVTKLDGMTQSELEALEDETVAADGENPDDATPASEPAKPADPPVKDAEPAAGEKEGEGGEAKSTDEPEADPVVDDELVKHVSPPSKWAEDRRAKRELSTRLDEAETKAARADVLEEELTTIKAELDWMKTAIQAKGVTLPETPLEVFSEDRITEIRDEFGDELADMFQGTAAILQKQVDAKAPAKVDSDTKAEPAPAAAAAATPAPAAPVAQPATETQVDPLLLKAIDENDELSYWQENSQPLWDKAIAMDSALLADPGYANLSYTERFAKVVESVKADVTKGAVTTPSADPNKPPESLSDSGGVAPTPNTNDALEKILATDDPEAQMKIYSGLSQSQKDEVDKALNI